jgi:hypothetical protein
MRAQDCFAENRKADQHTSRNARPEEGTERACKFLFPLDPDDLVDEAWRQAEAVLNDQAFFKLFHAISALNFAPMVVSFDRFAISLLPVLTATNPSFRQNH